LDFELFVSVSVERKKFKPKKGEKKEKGKINAPLQ